MATAYLIDSNVLIGYASKKFTIAAEKKLDTVFNESFNYSFISKIEVLGYNAPAEIPHLQVIDPWSWFS